MSLTSLPSYALGRERLSDAARQGLPYGLAISLHAALLALFIATPPGELLRIRGEVERLDVRFYTVSAPDAESDAQLVEPPLNEEDPADAAPAPMTQADTATDTTEAQPPVSEPVEEVEAPDETEAEAAIAVSEDGLATASPEAASTANRTPSTASVVTETSHDGASAPLATTQTRPSAPNSAPPAPSFADILARAETRLDPDDFRVVLSAGGVRGTVRESFCLSSSAANLEAGECPEGPNAASAELARFGLQGLGEEPPEFLVDLDRMEFQLRQMGANPSQVERIMLALRESRRDAVNMPALHRTMRRDRESRTDNLGNLIPDPE